MDDGQAALEGADVVRSELADREDLADLRARAAALAATWHPRAAASTTLGQERAVLRLFGITGLDRAGRPLAAEVVERYLGPDPRRLAGGIALPFAMAMAEYDLAPQELALEVAAGHVDLGLEAELLAEPDRRAVAVADATALARAAMDRIDANRTARRELIGVLGDRPRPWVAASLGAPAIVDAMDEARVAIEGGAEVLRVEVPPGRELAEHLARLGSPVEGWRAGPSSRGGLDGPDPDAGPVPSGAQRALAVLRRFVDEAGARRLGYVRLMTDTPALAAPDQATVAAFERVDIVSADLMREIVGGRVDPDRALADHAFAQRLLARAGARAVIPTGPLVVAPDLESGMPSDAATRAGRALALQLLAVSLAVRGGLAADDVIVDVLPAWIADEPHASMRAAAELAARRALLPEHPLAFVEPALDGRSALRWQALVAALLVDAPGTELLVRRPAAGPDETAARAAMTREASAVAAGLWRARRPAGLQAPAEAHLGDMVAAASSTLDLLEQGGWTALVDEPMGFSPGAVEGDAVAERTETFDPIPPAPGPTRGRAG